MTDHLKILIVEDNNSDADLLQRELKKNGFNFTAQVVETRESFKAALKNFNPDIILSDYSLPAFNGVEAFAITKENSPDTPFIIVSGTIGEEKSIELIKNGITDYALKENLFSLTPKIIRALKDANEAREKRITEKELKEKSESLLKIAAMQSHQVRVPVANILGLFSLFEFDDPAAPINATILTMLKDAAVTLDKTIIEIVDNTREIGSILDKHSA